MTDATTIITAALPYANGDIHIGHLVEYSQADIFTRHLRMQGRNALYLCADDAHGAPILLKAEYEGRKPEQLIAEMRQRHQADFTRFNIQFDQYHSTHSEENQALTTEIYQALSKGGYVRRREVKQLYDVKAGRFLADRYVKGTCPSCAAPEQYGDNCEACGATYDACTLGNPISQISKTVPEIRNSEHLFFDLGAFTIRIAAWLKRADIQPQVANKLQEWFSAGLEQWCISRDGPYFGFPIPDVADKYFYVWLDAPIGYLASLQAHADAHGQDARQQWQNPDNRIVHFIGKDIAYFHTLFWPAMLMGSGRRVPDAVYCHGFLTVNGRKMSKSRGTLVNAADFADIFEPDCFRYYLFSLLDDGINDLDLNLEGFKNKVNNDLVGKTINLGSRSSAILTRYDARFEALVSPELFSSMLAEMNTVAALIGDRKYSAACRTLMAAVDRANIWFDDQQPWVLAKSGDETERQAATSICSQALLMYRAFLIALLPVIPVLAGKGLSQFGTVPRQYKEMGQIDSLVGMQVPKFQHVLRRIEQGQVDLIEAKFE